jgi:FixJ family two-component response regulator
MNAQNATGTVYILDDDIYVRQGLESLLQSEELDVVTFASVAAFLKNVRTDAPSCLVLDVRLPGPSGLDLQAELKRLNIQIPIVFITGYGDIPMTVRAMRAGAVEFLTKPVREHELLNAVRGALKRDHEHRTTAVAAADLHARFNTLTARERDVVALVTSGKMNKQVAAELGVSEVTIKLYRRNAMKKLAARSVADLVRIVDTVGHTSVEERATSNAITHVTKLHLA